LHAKYSAYHSREFSPDIIELPHATPKKARMRRQIAIFILMLLAVFFTAKATFAQYKTPATADESTIVAMAQQVTLQALNFQEGDVQAFTRPKAQFTAEGWAAFMKHMKAWLDAKGAPKFTSSFTPTGNAFIAGRENGSLRIRIPGLLKQTHNKSSTTYRSYIEVLAGGEPIKIRHLEQVACSRNASTCP
jgi:hypothetical protein